ncbi:MAG: ABC transporter ATP-binding protein [Spirochaetota bacterium]
MGRMQAEAEEFRLSDLDRRHIRTVLRYLAPHRGRIAAAVVAMLVVTASTLALPLAGKVAIDRFVAAGNLVGLSVVAGAMLALAGLQWFAGYWQSYLSGWVGQHVVYAIRTDLHRKVMHQSLRFFQRERVGQIMSRLTHDVNSLSEFVSTGAVSLLNDLLTLVGIIVVMVLLDWRLAITALVSVPVILYGTRVLGRKMRAAYAALRREVAAVNVGAEQGVAGMRVSQSLRREAAGVEQFEGLSLQNLQANLRTSFFFAMLFPLMSITNMLSTVLVLAYGSVLLTQGAVTVGVLYAFFGYVNRFFGPVREMSLVYNQLQGAAGALDRIGEYMEIDEELPAPESPRRPDDGWRGGVSARGVSFAYDEEEEVLRDISFDAEAGSTTAVVGASGAGKTTLALLLARLYDPRVGRILLDGIDLREIDPAELRRLVVFLPQEACLFPGTIRENIRYGDPDATDERVETAASESRAHEIIAALPHGYDTDVGEAGHLLSGGQRQLIALARVLVTDPRVLILDEPTAHVDVLTESLIQESMAGLAGGRTTFIIAHRFSTLKHAERVLLVDEGELRGVGNHDELLESNGTYRSLYEKQWAQTEAP